MAKWGNSSIDGADDSTEQPKDWVTEPGAASIQPHADTTTHVSSGNTVPEAPIAPQSTIPLSTGSFVLGELLGRGGMAEVYLAHRTGPGGFMRKVVVKRILPHRAANQEFVERFIREATVAAQLHHPNIVEVLELGTTKGDYYLVMEFIAGRNLRDILQKQRLTQSRIPPAFAARIIADVATALHYAHTFVDDSGVAHRIVHRDVSPDNIMVTVAGQVKLVDFGVAKDLDSAAITMDRELIGKPLYMPPESLQGKPATPAWDIYGAGAVLYQLLAGRPAFEATDNLGKLLADIAQAEPPPLAGLCPDVPAD
jgi:eukaryotic-like serine/threonine-protein kinase